MPSRDPAAAAQVLVDSPTRLVDVGRVEGSGIGGLFFGIGVGLAMMSAASAELQRSRPLPGRLSYFVGGVVALLSFEAPHLCVSVDGATQSGRFMIVHIGLCPTTGGGFCLTPDASLDAGRLHVSTVTKRAKLLGLLQWPWLSRGYQLPGVKIATGKRVLVTGEPGTLIHVDGELLRLPEGALEVTLLRRELQVVAAGQGPPTGQATNLGS